MQAPEMKDVPAQTVIAIEHRGGHDEIGQVYHKLHEWAQARGLIVTGRGLTIFLGPPSESGSQTRAFEVCLPVASTPAGDAAVKVRVLPGCTVAAVTVKGGYDRIPAHYAEMLAWLSAEGREIVGAPREVYIKRPDARGGGEPEEFLTEIQFPIAG